MMMLQRRLLLSATLLAFLGQMAIAREWSDATGKFKTEAELVKVAGDMVFLKKQSDGATIQVPIARLSELDQVYLQSLQSPVEVMASGKDRALPLATADCMGLIVLDPKPVLQQDALGMAPLKDLIDNGVALAGIDFRELDRLTVYLFKPDLQSGIGLGKKNGIAVAEFSVPVDPASMLVQIPTDYEAATIAGKACHKPAESPNPWVCVIDEKTLAFSTDEDSLTAALTATGDEAELTQLLATTGPGNEFRHVLSMTSVKELIAPLTQAMTPPPQVVKILGAIEKMNSIVLTSDLDGPPSLVLSIMTGDEAAAAELQPLIEEGLEYLPVIMKSATDAAQESGAGADAMPVSPDMAAQMLSGMSEKIGELLAFEQEGATLKISVKFPADAPPLAQTLVQVGTFAAMMSQQSGSGGPFGASE